MRYVVGIFLPPATAYLKKILFKHQRQRAQATYKPVKSSTMNIVLHNETRQNSCTIDREIE